MLAFHSDERPSPKAGRVCSMTCLVGRKGVINNKTCTPSEVPRCLLSNIVEQVAGAPGRHLMDALGKQMI